MKNGGRSGKANELGQSGAAGEAGTGGAPAQAGAGMTNEAGAGGEVGTASSDGRFTLDLSGLTRDILAYPPPAGVTDARRQAARIVAALTADEKMTLLAGSRPGVVGGIAAVGPLPELSMDDGPGGVARLNDVTAFPDPITLAATWDRDLVQRWGAAMGAEERGKGVAVQLGPELNLSRSPLGGRDFEGFGEDPYLAAELAGEDVTGIQSNMIVATAKHFVGNEQELNRMTENSVIDERTLHEVYYLPFEAAVSAGVGSVMCSYNQVNGLYACDNPTTLGDLKNELGFSGWVMTDWNATHGPDAAVSGLDMEMPGARYFTAANISEFPASTIDEMATRVVTSLLRLGVVDNPPTGTEPASSLPLSTARWHLRPPLRASRCSRTIGARSPSPRASNRSSWSPMDPR